MEEIASAVLWLGSSGAAFTISQAIGIDGGFTVLQAPALHIPAEFAGAGICHPRRLARKSACAGRIVCLLVQPDIRTSVPNRQLPCSELS